MTERDTMKQEFASALRRLRLLPEAARARLQSQFAQTLLAETFDVTTPRGRLSFVLFGRGTAIRARSLLTKQPATIEWIDAFRPHSVFWDVGANVGIYSLYAALRGDTRVVAFEPAAVNYFLLTANCEVNRLADRVNCLLVGLGRGKGLGRLAVSQFSPAESFSFRRKQDGKEYSEQAALLLSIDELVDEFDLVAPNYIKIDVPGLTEEIIMGGVRTLRRQDVRELHVEMRERSESGRRIVETLRALGFAIVGRPARGDTTDVMFARPDSQPLA
jgi:FkbM family methyltransferase